MVEIDKIKLTQIKKAEYNPRTISEENYAKLKNSVKNFGLVEPILINLKNNTIISGHQRYDVLTDLILADGNLAEKEFHLLKYGDLGLILDTDEPTLENEDYEKALNITLNNTNLTGEYDFEKLSSLLEDLEINDFNIELTGFNGLEDIDFDLEGFDWEHEAPQFTDNDYEGMEDNYEIDDDLEVTVQNGDLYKLGEHYLLCGDSTVEANVKKLMQGAKADISFTSPPYNLGATGEFGNKNKAMNVTGSSPYKTFDDDLNNDDYSNLLINAMENSLKYAEDSLFNIGILANSKIGIINLLKTFEDNFCDLLVWKKDKCLPLGNPTQSGCVNHLCEFIFCFNEKGNRAFNNPQWKQGTQTNIIETVNASGNSYAKMHGATFPIDLPSYIIQNFSKYSVLDLFGGTGTTLIAAEQLNRQCYMMELDPYYCQVIINRWEEFTGEKAEKIS